MSAQEDMQSSEAAHLAGIRTVAGGQAIVLSSCNLSPGSNGRETRDWGDLTGHCRKACRQARDDVTRRDVVQAR